MLMCWIEHYISNVQVNLIYLNPIMYIELLNRSPTLRGHFGVCSYVHPWLTTPNCRACTVPPLSLIAMRTFRIWRFTTPFHVILVLLIYFFSFCLLFQHPMGGSSQPSSILYTPPLYSKSGTVRSDGLPAFF